MRVEHIAFIVDDPNAVSKWYCDNLGMRQVRQGPGPNFMTFLADEGERDVRDLPQPGCRHT
jgi:catechol 2,3-dioxygenase-like lactoylglutathione lyase family enzyme